MCAINMQFGNSSRAGAAWTDRRDGTLLVVLPPDSKPVTPDTITARLEGGGLANITAIAPFARDFTYLVQVLTLRLSIVLHHDIVPITEIVLVIMTTDLDAPSTTHAAWTIH